MPSNIEIKARATDLDALRRKVESLGASAADVKTLDQEDIFFAAPSGRLKLRILGPQQGELILYHRPDIAGPKMSDYRVAPTSAPDVLRSILAQVLPTLAVVRKRRWLYHLGQTRVHLDRVEGLGDFIELEVVLRADQPEQAGVAIAADLMRKLGISDDQLVEQAYVDLLATRP